MTTDIMEAELLRQLYHGRYIAADTSQQIYSGRCILADVLAVATHFFRLVYEGCGAVVLNVRF